MRSGAAQLGAVNLQISAFLAGRAPGFVCRELAVKTRTATRPQNPAPTHDSGESLTLQQTIH